MKSKDIHELTGYSLSTISKIRNNKCSGSNIVIEKVEGLLSFETESLRELFADEKMFDCMELVISKARNNQLVKFAVFVQRASEILRHQLEISSNGKATEKELEGLK